MFRPMRRFKQALSPEECRAVLERGTSGVLALSGDEGWPYAVPLSYVYADGKLYFHSAQSGHKVDAVRNCPKASFCVVAQDQVAPLEYTTLYRSVIVFGTVRELTDPAEKRAAIEALARRYAPDEPAESVDAEIARYWDALCMLELAPAQITGKQCIELVGQ